MIRDSQLIRLQRYLCEGREISVYESIVDLGIAALSQRIGNLRKLGFPVKSRRAVGRSRYSIYFIPPALLARARKMV